MKRAKQVWIWMREGGDHYRFECERCGHSLRVMLPCSMAEMIDAAKAFTRLHRRCPRTLHGERMQLLQLLRRRANPAGGTFTFRLGVG